MTCIPALILLSTLHPAHHQSSLLGTKHLLLRQKLPRDAATEILDGRTVCHRFVGKDNFKKRSSLRTTNSLHLSPMDLVSTAPIPLPCVNLSTWGSPWRCLPGGFSHCLIRLISPPHRHHLLRFGEHHKTFVVASCPSFRDRGMPPKLANFLM